MTIAVSVIHYCTTGAIGARIANDPGHLPILFFRQYSYCKRNDTTLTVLYSCPPHILMIVERYREKGVPSSRPFIIDSLLFSASKRRQRRIREYRTDVNDMN